ncbi:MAG TPA: CinA family protein [Phototrophicaceae bacterium]|jgi:PncC family amidohydrolase|nr:CinA family protein [Phototrophicaceae bacterium]
MSDQTVLPELQVGIILRERACTISTAESCTGGLIAHRLTNISGSSAYVMGAVVVYSNEIKQAVLHVREDTLIEFGAVSEPVARQMAANCRALFGTDYALSVTGIAGPGGGSAEKPVGLTYIGCAAPDGRVVVQRFIWEGDREANKASSADAALNLLLELMASA